MMYDSIENHFAAEIAGRLYDVTGDVTGRYKMIPWDDYDDKIHKKCIERDCIFFLKEET